MYHSGFNQDNIALPGGSERIENIELVTKDLDWQKSQSRVVLGGETNQENSHGLNLLKLSNWRDQKKRWYF